jgi:hypothetical protein
VLPVGLPGEGPVWNLEALWARLGAELPRARMVRGERMHEQDHRPGVIAEAARAARGVGKGVRRLFGGG